MLFIIIIIMEDREVLFYMLHIVER